MPLSRLGLRYLVRRPLQSLLVVLGIALGVAVVIAIDLANGSASRAFALSTEAVAGRATHQISGGPTGLPDTLYGELRRELGLRAVAPVVSEYVRVEALGRPLRLLGVDPFAEAPFRSYLGGDDGRPDLEPLVAFLTEPNSILLSAPVAASAGVGVGDTLRLGAGSREIDARVVGLLDPADELSQRALDGLILADVASAQEMLGQVGRLTTLDLILPEGAAGEEVAAAIRARLPADAVLAPAAARTNTLSQLTAAFELNLSALALLALVVGMFLIYNTVTFSVVQRRPVLGTLRALGVTRREIGVLILAEAAALGVVGGLIGVALGIVLGRGAVRLITQTINDLYFVVSVQGVALAPETLLKGLALGVGAALLAALAPAWEAASVPPVTAMRRSSLEGKVERLLPRLGLAALALGALGVGLLFGTRSLVLAFGGLFAVILAFALATPLVTVGAMALVARPLALIGLPGRLAPRDIRRALSRTSVAIAALMVAVSVIVGVTVMVDSFRQTVTDWLDATLRADVYLSPPGVASNRADAPLDPGVREIVAREPGVARVEAARNVFVRSPDLGEIALIAVSGDVSQGSRRFVWAEGSPAAAWARVMAGEGVLITEPLALRHSLGRGDELRLLTARGERRFPILGVYYDYASDQGNALMPLDAYRALYDDPLLSSVAAYVEPGVEPDAVVEALRQRFVGESLVIRSNAALRENALAVFERTFAITGALQGLATIVAFIGVLAALMALQLERSRELGTLRAVGMTERQLWGLTLVETGLMGGTAGLWALPTGLALALVLVYVINRRSFGWTLELALDPMTLVQAVAVALVAALLAGLYPAYRLSHLRVSEAIRAE